MAQLVKRPTLDFHSVHDLVVRGFDPTLGSMLIGILSLSPSLPQNK